MRNILPFLFLWAFLVKEIVSAPLGTRITDPNYTGMSTDSRATKKQVARLAKAATSANVQINKMHDVASNAQHAHNQAQVRQAFGNNPNFHQIAQNINTLKHGTITVDHLNQQRHGQESRWAASTNTQTNNVHLHPPFHNKKARDDHARGGILIHESAHALFNAKDHFSATSGRPIPVNDVAHHGNTLSGYAHSPDFNTLRTHHSPNMHHNADSYKKFGEIVTGHSGEGVRQPSSSGWGKVKGMFKRT